MPDQLFTPAPDFSHPLGLLMACHQRIAGFLETLLKFPDHLRQHGTDAEARQAAERVLKYFDTAAPHHHDDEEKDLFPLLRETAQLQGNREIPALLDELLAQHVEMFQAWRDLRPHLLALAEGKAVDPAGMPVERFAALYRRHIPLEENSVLPYAMKILSSAQLEALGEGMARRRGVE